jgi:UDP-glucose:(heptosyl)LPS alpha-1,3-glucosyltransferase
VNALPQPERLRVAYAYRHFGGHGSLSDLFRRNAERLGQDEDVTVVCSERRRAATASKSRFETVEPVVLGAGRLGYALECASFAVRATRHLADARERFDVIHVDGFAALSADLVTMHAVRPAELEHYFTHVEPRARLRRKLTPYVLRPQVGVVLAVERSLYGRQPPLTICPSAEVREHLERWYGVPPELVRVIPYGIDTEIFRTEPAERARRRALVGVPEDRLVLLFLGDDFERKGLGRALRGLGGSTTPAELWVLGGGDVEPYRALARELGVAERVRFFGRRPRTELTSWYAAGDVVLLPSRQDAWGLTVGEGLAAGRVVVASRHAGAHSLIEEGVTGFVLSGDGDPKELAALLDGPLADPAVRKVMMERARTAVAALDYEVVYRRMREAHHEAFELRLARASSRQGSLVRPRLDSAQQG